MQKITKRIKYRGIKASMHLAIVIFLIGVLFFIEQYSSFSFYYFLIGVCLILLVIEIFMILAQFVWNVYEIMIEQDYLEIEDLFFGKVILYNDGIITAFDCKSKNILDILIKQRKYLEVYTITKTFRFYERDFKQYDKLRAEIMKRVEVQNGKN